MEMTQLSHMTKCSVALDQKERASIEAERPPGAPDRDYYSTTALFST